MRRVAHLSDLHFGTDDPVVTEGLLRDLADLAPDLVVVSGDLTQRARSREFRAARAFLDRIQQPLLVVPGNHDIPLFDVARRFLTPLARYRRHITSDLAPYHEDDVMAVLGVNTARSRTWKEGRISEAQIEAARARFCALERPFKVLVTHHPLLPPVDALDTALVGRAPEVLRAVDACGFDLLLAGHLHRGYSGDLRTHHVTLTRSILAVHAGTATSTRLRGEPNSYNLLTLDPPRLALEVRAWSGARFAPTVTTRYAKGPEGWRPALL